MKLQPYIEKLYSSSEYKQFTKKYNDAFLVAGFFVLDLEFGKNIHQIDFYIPSQKKFAAFTLDEGINIQILDMMGDNMPEKMNIETKIDLDSLNGIIEDEMKNRNMTEEIKKIIAVIQNVKGKKIWNINCVLSGMEILKTHIEDASQTILKMEKISFSEIMKKIPMDMQPQASRQAQGPQIAEEVEVNEEEAKEELKKLDDLQVQIKKEKARLKNELSKEKSPKKEPKAEEKISQVKSSVKKKKA